MDDQKMELSAGEARDLPLQRVAITNLGAKILVIESQMNFLYSTVDALVHQMTIFDNWALCVKKAI